MTIKNTIRISLLIVLALSVSLSVFLIRPIFSGIKKNSEELINQKQRINFLEEKIKNIEDFKKNQDEIGKNLEKIKTLFLESEAPVNFIGFLEQTARESQLSIKISPSASTKKAEDPWFSIIFEISSASPFPSLLRFLEKLESSPYLIKIQSFSVTRLEENDLKTKELEDLSVGSVKAILSMKVYAN